jgi:hypothetical protein
MKKAGFRIHYKLIRGAYRHVFVAKDGLAYKFVMCYVQDQEARKAKAKSTKEHMAVFNGKYTIFQTLIKKGYEPAGVTGFLYDNIDPC